MSRLGLNHGIFVLQTKTGFNFKVLFWLFVFALTKGAALQAQGEAKGSATPPKFESEQPNRLDIPNLETRRVEVAPVIDGLLDEDCWQSDPQIAALRQAIPVAGAEASEATTIHVLYDDDYFYLGIRCFDSEPSEIVATQLLRDGSLGADDRVTFILDTFFDRRNAYLFEVNAVGAKGDALVGSSGNINRDWDGIWLARTGITTEGWHAEIAIPIKTISFAADSQTWGLNIQRVIRRKNETLRWASPTPNSVITDIGDAGLAEAIDGLEQGLGLDIKPFISNRYRHVGGDEFEFVPGLDVFYKITPSLTAAFTVNTDFAEAEVDERRVNLTRFPLFFPEKRDFFLQDAGIFRFGGIQSDPLPFFSRRIGIGPRGQPVDILAGIKVTGRVGRLNIGVLDVQTDSSDNIDGKNLAVARMSINVLDESDIGFIATYGDPQSDNDNALVGLDFNFRDSKVWGDNVLDGHLWAQKSFTSGVDGDDLAYGIKVGFPNDQFSVRAGASETQVNFNPALGFRRRFGIREYFYNLRYRHRTAGYFRTLDFGTSAFIVTNLDNEIESRNFGIDLLSLQTRNSDGVQLGIDFVTENLDSDFEIFRGIVIPTGDYDYTRFSVSASSSSGRPLSGNVFFRWGDFYDGTRTDLGFGLTLRASRHLYLNLEYEQNDIRLRAGDFKTQIARARINFLFSADVSWNTFVQYDNVSDLISINSRLRWIFQPGRELFFVVNQGFDVERDRFASISTTITLKLGWTFRF